MCCCYSNSNLAQLVSSSKKSPYLSTGPKVNKLKGSSQSTRKESAELNESQKSSRRYKSWEENPLFEIYDNELDVTILSSDSDELSGSHIISELNYGEDEDADFELLIEENNKETSFLNENNSLFSEMDGLLASI